jgi:hypothetical protein
MLQPLLNFLGLRGAPAAEQRYAVDDADPVTPEDPGLKAAAQEDEQSTASSEGHSTEVSTSDDDRSSPVVRAEKPRSTLHTRPPQSVRTFRHLAYHHAHTGFDLQVAWCLCELLGIEDLVDEDFMKTFLETLSLLHRCGYTVDVTVMSVAWTAIYCKDGGVREALLTKPTSTLAQMRVCMSLFLAHVYLVDEPCFLSTWHKYVFYDICQLEELNMELMRLFKIRNYKLIVDKDECDCMYAVFTDAMCKGAPGKRVVEAIARDEEGVPLCVDGDY